MTKEGKDGRKGVAKLKQFDMVQVADVLRQYCKSVNGFAVYEEGWNDERVVKEMVKRIPYINVNHIYTLRRSLLGNLAPKMNGNTIAQLLRRIEQLEAWAAARPVQPFKREEEPQ